MDWIMRPVLHNLCTLKELQDGTYDLADVAMMHDALDVQAENEARAHAAAEAGARNGR